MVIYPGDWEVKKLGEVCKISSGFMGDFRLTRGKYRITRIETIADGFIDEHKVGYSNVKPDDSFRLRFGDILYSNINSIAHIGKVAQYKNESELYHGANLLRLVPCVNVSADFLFYLLISERSRTWARINANPAVNQASINQSLLKSQEIILPPLKEQTAIAETLAAFDTHITNLTELITKKKAIRDGALDDLMSGRTRLEGFCGDWEVKTLGECGKFVSGNGFPLKHQGQRKGAYPFYKVSDFSNEGNENYMFRANNYISDDVAKKLSCNIIPAASVIFAKIGAAIFLERKRITTCDCCIDNNMMSFQPSQNISSRFIWYLMQKLKFGDYVQTTALPSLSGKILADILIPLPTLDEQIAIADTLSALDKEISSLETERAKISQICDGAMNDLLTGKVRLKIGI